MFTIRKAGERGHADHGWLDTNHTFSFAGYYDPRWMGFSVLRVINEDRVQPGQGFPTHPHRDMEIISLVLEGALEHRDSMGNGSVIRPGEIQRMSAGTGVTHSEYNHSASEVVHFLQIWIVPERERLAPGYEQTTFPVEAKQGRLLLVASPDGRDGSVIIHQNAALYTTILRDGDELLHHLVPGRNAWVHLIRGSALVNGHELAAGDGAAVTDDETIRLTGRRTAELLLFDLP